LESGRGGKKKIREEKEKHTTNKDALTCRKKKGEAFATIGQKNFLWQKGQKNPPQAGCKGQRS